MSEANKPCCLVLMPFDKRKDCTGREIDFEAVYRRLVVPAVEAAGLQAVRGDEGRTGGLGRRLLERLALFEYVLADLSAASPTVFYTLGIRHASQPRKTVLIHAASRAQLPFDAQALGAVSYRVSPQGHPEYEAKYRTVITDALKKGDSGAADSPLFRQLPGYPNLDRGARLKAAEAEAGLEQGVKQSLLEARSRGGGAVRAVEASLGNLAEVEPGVVLELFFGYREAQWWNEMTALVPRMAPVLAGTLLVQEQLALALNRMGKGAEAERVLRDLLARRGPSATTYGKLGRVLKYQWEKAAEKGDKALAKELLDKAATAYWKGFEADWRDTYSGVNAVTLMELKQPADPRRREILPVVHYAVEQRIRSGAADYWDYATLLELAVLACDEAKAAGALGQCLARVRESWEAQTTAKKLRLIREARLGRGADCPVWADNAVEELLKAAARWTARP
ncbi:TRAFs-binding domain-containing protein [Geomonas sp.]|uniref:TRAFs-binding domain-containing protein n=1 Tax=Geomonas sp. TaxID=2651584 RepID=UPI002B480084|nr:TRAFs-binding domain-containing protein [Geomonas sp.]HJV37002.1 TRAFs-binding domain-containing protein [Geomonas sp.]